MQIRKEDGVVIFVPDNQQEFEILRELDEKGIRRTCLSQSWDSKFQELKVVIADNAGWSN